MLRMVLYFDVFHHPLRRVELAGLVGGTDPDAARKVDGALATLAARGLVQVREEWCFRPGRGDGIARRRQRARNAERLWPLAAMASSFLARLPFVRGVLITGGLSKGSAARQDDVDFLLLVQPGRVWTLKSMLQAMRRSWPRPVRELFCTNYLLATDRPQVDDRNVFTAVELATAVPMYGPEECHRLLVENAWAERFVPGLAWSRARAAAALPLPTRRVARVLEGPLAGRGGQRLERAAVGAWDRYWNRKYRWLDDATRAQRFKRRDDVATNHLHDFQGYVLRELGWRLRAAGLDEPVALTGSPTTAGG
ncbi:MAG: hypothetical protein D6798_03085 [Deltaproteobacteria bacterium]|nr:MAG: hypothetical protein D6798_03085 [Deltaproteobacteria bacterium]